MTRHPHNKLYWQAAVLGGLVAIGASAFSGTVVANASLYFLMCDGKSLEQAYATLRSNFFSGSAIASGVAQFFSAALGGAVAAHYGQNKPLLHAFVAGVVSLAFVVAMYISPAPQAVPAWYVVVSVAMPLISSLIGGFAYARKT